MENISKQVVLSSGKKIGYILDIALSGLDKVGYYVVDEETESEFLLKNENILKISKDYLLIEDEKLEFVGNRPLSIFGREVLDEFCNSLGFVREIEFKHNKCVKIITEICEILPKNVKNIGEDVIFLSFKRKREANFKRKPFPKIDIDMPVKIQSQPEKVVLSPKFYLGKISTENIFGYNKEKIVLKNEVITKATFEKAKLHNKLNQLFFAIKR